MKRQRWAHLRIFILLDGASPELTVKLRSINGQNEKAIPTWSLREALFYLDMAECQSPH